MKRIKQQLGVALISVLLMVTIISIVLASMFYRHQLDITRASHSLVSEQAVLLALSAENWVRQLLLEDSIKNDTDNLFEAWALPIPQMNVEGGQLSGCVIDQQGLFNINNLMIYASRQQITDELEGKQHGTVSLLQRVFSDLAYSNPNERIAVVADWLDFDGTINAYGGVEDGQYLLDTPARLAGNQALSSIDELSSLSGFSVLEMPVLKTKLTALPKATPINVNTAPIEILESLVDGLDQYIVEDVVISRPFSDIAEFYQLLSTLLHPTTEEQLRASLPEAMVSVKSEFFQLKSKVELGGITLLFQSLLYRASNAEVKVLQRQLIPMPNLLDQNGDPLPPPAICPLANVISPSA